MKAAQKTARPPAPGPSEAAIDLGRSSVARYLQLSSLFRRRIEYGDWPVGQQIPTLEMLTAECGVAPATIRKALDSLVQEGFLARYRAKGTYVLRGPTKSLWHEIETTGSGVLQARQGPDITLLSRDVVDVPPFVPQGDGKLGESYLHFRRIYARDNRPFLLNDHYLDMTYAKDISRRDLQSLPAQALLSGVKDLVISASRATLTITSADIEAAHHLDLPLNAPVARIDRVRLDDKGGIVMIGSGIYRGDVIRLDFKGG